MPRFKVRIEGGGFERAASELTRSGFIINPDTTLGQAVVGTVEAESPEDALRRVRDRLPKGSTATYVASE